MKQPLITPKQLLTLLVLIFSISAKTQVKIGVNPSSMDASAMLQIDVSQTSGSAKGFLLPRVPLTSLTDATTITSPATGLVVYATGGALAAGLYTWNGTAWVTYDVTNDAWVNNPTNTRVELGTTSTGSTRTTGTEFVARDNGNVGIGTATPGARLEVYRQGGTEAGNWIAHFGNTSARVSIYEENMTFTRNGAATPNSGGGIYFSAANNAIIESSQGGIVLASRQSNKNIGIHTYNPLRSFHIDGGQDNPGTGAPSSTLGLNDFVVTNTGSVGIGLLTPSNKLHVSGNALFAPRTANDGSTGEPVSVEIYGRAPSGGLSTYGGQAGGLKFFWYNTYSGIEVIRGFSSTGAGLAFNTANLSNGTTTESMRIMPDGNVGIGTSNPINKFEVNQGTAGNSGIRTTQMISSTSSLGQDTTSPIGVTPRGDIVRMSSLQASITSSLTTTTAITNTPTAIPFNVNDQGPYGTIQHSTSTNNTRFTVTRAGIYVFFVQPQTNKILNANENCTFWFRLNGTTPISNSAANYNVRDNGSNIAFPISITLDLAANDYIEVMTTASNTNVYELSNISGSGSGSSAIPNVPACIIDVKGYFK